MRLKKLIQELPQASVFGPVNRDVRGIACQALRVGADMVYVALPEDDRDPWEDADCAVNRGAFAVICEKESLVSRRATRIQVPDVRDALARTAASYYGRPSAGLFVVGVVADRQSKVIASLLHSMLQAAGRKAGLITSVQHQAGDRPLPKWPFRAQSLDIQQSLAHMASAGCTTCVVEIAPEEARLKQFLGVEFDLWIEADMTGRRDPSNFQDSDERYQLYKEWDKSKAAVINIDAVFGSRFSREWTPTVQLTDGTPVPSSLRAGQLHLGLHGSRFVVSLPERSYDCRLPSPYLEDVYNALASLQAARALGLPAPAIAEGLRNYAGVPGRLEPVRAGQPFHVFVDQARTPDDLRVALYSLKRICEGRLFLVVGSQWGVSQENRQKLGGLAAHLADQTIFTTDNPKQESPLSIAATMAEGYRARRPDGFEIVLDRHRAIRRALASAEPGDCVLIAGKGTDSVQEMADTILPFDDRVQTRAVLESLGFEEE